ncbi:hypothetical protein [Bacillus alveayuensis]|uniref:hypothetical protein n=1 Tax=Aeribacillus alveayuensis TaxID=279215 RepID=UPI0005CCA7F8|nr:hypothetical protein [Bacillus alveayuensis]
MKQITLQQMLDTNCYKSILDLKSELIRYKYTGIIFYRETMSSLELDVPFEFYFVLPKGTNEYKNAFPVPIAIYHKYLLFKRTSEYLVHFYQDYYKTKCTPPDEFFQTLNIFQAKQYAWFYN